MLVHVVESKHTGGHRVWLSFDDHTSGEIDLSSELEGTIFEPLKNPEYFKTFKIEGHTLSWDNGADFAPEFLHEKIAQQHASGAAANNKSRT